MNRVYRVVWCHIRNTYIVASELASRKKVKSSKQVNLKAGLQVGAVLTAIATMGIAGAADLNPEQIVVLDKDGQQIVLNQEAIEGLNKLAIVLGSGAKAPSYTNDKGELKKNNDAVVIGNNAETNQERSIAIGSDAKSTLDSVVIGNKAQASLHLDNPTSDTDKTYGMTVIGAEAKAEGKSAMAIGFRSESKGTNASAIGGGAKAMSPYSTAIGATASALANNTVAIGVNSVASGDGSSAIGMEAKASSNSTTAIGLKSEARAQQSIAVGAKSIANEAYTVSFGHDAIPAGKDQWGRDKAAEKELNRRLVHVDKGRISEKSTDAINGSQLYASNKATVEALGGEAKLHDGTIPGTIPGSIKGPSYVLNNKQDTFYNVGDALYNLDGRIDVNKGNITNILEGKAGLVKLDGKEIVINNAITGADTATFNFANADKSARTLTGVADGQKDNDAVNVSQLKEVDGKVETNTTNIAKNKTLIDGNTQSITQMGDNIKVVESNVGANTANITLQGKTLEGVAEALGGGSSIDSDTGVLSMPNYADALGADDTETVNDGVDGGFEYVGGKLTEQDKQITNIEGDVKNIGDNVADNSKNITKITNGEIGLVKLGDNNDIVFDADLAKDRDTFNVGDRKISNLAAGVEDKDAVNVSQLKDVDKKVDENTTNIAGNKTLIEGNTQNITQMGDNIKVVEGNVGANTANITLQGKTLEGVAEALGGGSSIDSDTGVLSMPNYADALGADDTETVNDGVDGGFEYVGGKLTEQDKQITNIEGDVKNIGDNVADNSKNITKITNGEIGLVKLGDNNDIVFDADLAKDRDTFNVGDRKISNLAAGVEDKDAVNVSQLKDVDKKVDENTTNIAGNKTLIEGNTQNITQMGDNIKVVEGNVGANTANIAGNKTLIEGNKTLIEGNTANITLQGKTLEGVADALGGGSSIDSDTGVLSMPNYAKVLGADSPVEGVEEGFRYVKGELTGISTGTAGLVKLDGDKIIFDNDLAKGATSFDISNGTDARTLTGVANGVADNDAVNVSQLTATTKALGGGTTINADGSITGPTYNITNVDGKKVEANDVGTALETIDGNVVNNTKNITNITAKSDASLKGIEKAFGGKAEFDADGNLKMPNYKDALGADSPIEGVEAGFEYVGEKLTEQGEQITNIDGRVTTNEGDIKNITSGKAGLVQLNGDKIVIDNSIDGANKATSFDLHNGDDTRKITGVSAGTIGKDSTDAITGGQLYDTGKYVVDSLGGTALVDVKTGEFTGPDFADSLGIKAENGTTKPKITTVAKGFEYLSNNLGDLNTGKAGLLQLSDDGKKLVFSDVANSADTFDLSNDGKTRTLTSVTAGKVAETSTDAINGSQLHATNKSIVDALGGGSKLDENGNITGPTYNITNVDGKKVEANDVGTALETIDGNVVNNTKNITSLTNNVNNINNGTAGLVKVDGDKIVFDSSIAGNRTFDISNNGEARTLTGVKDGALAADSKDAVNGGQLHATNQNVAQNSDNVGKLAESLGGGASVGADGKITGPTYTFTDNSVHTNVGSALENLDGRVDGVEKKVDGIANGTAGLVKLSDDGKSLVIDNGLASKADTFDLSNGDKDRTLTGVADGKVESGSKDAINGGQLHTSNSSIADIFGGGASVDKDGYVSMPSYELGADKPFDNVGDSLTYLSNSMKNGDGGLFKLDRENNQVILEHKEINEKTTVNIGNRVMTGVANGNVAEGSLDAVNGGQLWTTNQQVSSNTNQIKHIHNTMNHYNNRLNHVERTVHQNRKVASAGISGAMAMSSIPYVEHTKYSLGMGVASYDGEAAMSIGLTFKVGDNGRFRIQGSYDTQNKMGVGAGIAFEL